MDRYGAALFGYQQSAAVAIAANARRNEIAYDGFEDYDFDLKGTQESCPMKRHFDWMLSKDNMYGLWMNASGGLSDFRAHTGKHSLLVDGALTIGRPAGLATPPTSLFTISNGKYQLSSNELGNGFGTISTSPGKEYLLSMWIYDGKPQSGTLNNVTISVNGTNYDNARIVPVVEGWKRVELKFTGGYFSMQISPVVNTGGVFIDDFRIQPLNAKLNTYVYDERTLRLMAQLDENNYATLYEYDDEGTPIRVKKETERGIVTLKENRKFIRQR
jgi:hypothetical protein